MNEQGVLARLRGRGRSVPHIDLRALETAKTGRGRPRDPAGRFELAGKIGRGGIGIVLRGRDPDLGREVAVKMLRQRHLRAPGIVQRFVEEAQIGGQLQHPGIVPVYELGLRTNGQPFFAMKLVRGETLAAILAARSDPSADAKRILSIFERVCQTVAYAHARGVVHRDLKPSNVMVGSFGEVQVIDWGFAKVFSRGRTAAEVSDTGPPHDASRIATVRTESDGSESHVGSVMGTPAYMPPEQALGQVDALDERSDVFALGAILCEVLTGRPPYVPEHGDVLVQAAAGSLDHARSQLDACGADPGLTALCLSCIAAAPVARPRHAGAVADAVTGHLAAVEARAQRARIGAIEERTRAARAKTQAEEARAAAAAERRRRRQARALAAAVLLAVVVIGGGWLTWERDRAARTRASETSVQEWLDRAAQLRGDGAYAGAVEAAQRACEVAAEEGLPAWLRERATRELENTQGARSAAERAQRETLLLERLQAIRIRLGDGFEFDKSAADRAFRDAFRQAGCDPQDASELDAYRKPGEISAALRDWAELQEGRVPEAVDSDAEQDAGAFWVALQRARSQMRLQSPQAGSAIHSYLAALAHKPDHACLWHQLAVAYRASDDYERALRASRRATETTPHHAGHQLLYGIALEELGLQEEATAAYRDAVARDGGSADAALRLGVALQRAGRAGEAVEQLQAAVRTHPQRADLQFAFANALCQAGHSAAAVAPYRAAAALDPSDATTHNNLGVALLKDGLSEQALAALRQAVELAPRRREARYNLALALRALDATDDAIAQLRQALAWDGDRKPTHVPWGALLADAGTFAGAEQVLRAALQAQARADLWCDLGDLHRRQRKFGAAVAAFDRAIALEPRHGRAHTGRGMALLRLGRMGRSLASLRHGAVLSPEDACAHSKFGYGLARSGRFEAAKEPLRRALDLDAKLAEAHFYLGVCFERTGKPQEAVGWIQRALALDPELAHAHNAVSVIQTNNKWDLEAAVRASHAAIRLQPRNPQYWENLGNALRLDDDAHRAAEAYRRAIELDAGAIGAHINLGVTLADHLCDYDGAIAVYREALRHIPERSVQDRAKVLRNVGVNLRQKGDFEGSAVAHREAVQIAPHWWEAWTGYGGLFVQLGDFAEAETAFREAIRCAPRRLRPRVSLGEVLLPQGKYREAIQAWQDACEVDPKDPGPMQRLAWILATCPDGTLRDPPRAVALAERAASLAPNTTNLRTWGAALCRVGQYAAALEKLEQASAQYLDGGGSAVRICLAMTHHGLGHEKEARAWLRSAAALVDSSRIWTREYLRQLLKESQRVLDGEGE